MNCTGLRCGVISNKLTNDATCTNLAARKLGLQAVEHLQRAVAAAVVHEEEVRVGLTPRVLKELIRRQSLLLVVGPRRLLFETDGLKAFLSCFTFKG